MIKDQRAPQPSGSDPAIRPLWRPAESAVARDAADAPSDEELVTASYVAIDRIDADVVTVAIAPWPRVDRDTGRLDFGPRDERLTTTVAASTLTARLDAERAATGQLVRPLRVGDVFAVQDRSGPVARWGRIRDVTRAARLAAKAALFSTVAPAPPADRAEEYGIAPTTVVPAPGATTETEETPPPGPVAYPAV